MKKPKWVVDKERGQRAAARETIWIYGLHAVADALRNPRREKLRLVVTRNALQKLGDAIEGVEPEIADARKFPAPLERDAVHQGAALETRSLAWGGIDDCLALMPERRPLVVCLDRVTDPHNAGANPALGGGVSGRRRSSLRPGTRRHRIPVLLAKAACGGSRAPALSQGHETSPGPSRTSRRAAFTSWASTGKGR